MLTLAVGCSELYGPEETPLTPDKAGSVEITFSDVADDSFTVTVTPTGNVSYYSYLVDDSDAAQVLDAETLYKVGYASVAQGTVKYTSDAPSYTFVVNAQPNTTYQVYAVAASEMGFPGTVVTNSVKTTDTVSPTFKSYTTEENQVVFTFSEAVTRNAEAGSIKVPYYAYYTNAFQTQGTPAGEVTVPETAIQVSGNQATITVPNLPTGAYWTIDIPAGAFLDSVGQPIPAYKSGFQITANGPAPTGFYGSVEYTEVPMFGEVDLESIDTWDAAIVVPLVNKYPLANYNTDFPVTVTYSSETSNSVSETVYTLEANVDYGVTSLGFVIALPEEPRNGTDLTISIPTGCLYDIYGNDSEGVDITTKYLNGYTLESILGGYMAEETSIYKDGDETTYMEIVESDDPSKGNVMFSYYWDMECQIPIYANFDTETGELTIPSGQIFTAVSMQGGGSAYCCFASADIVGSDVVPLEDDVVWSLNGPNKIVGPNYYYGIYAIDRTTEEGIGWFNCFYEISASLGGSRPAAATASAPVFKKVKTTEEISYTL